MNTYEVLGIEPCMFGSSYSVEQGTTAQIFEVDQSSWNVAILNFFLSKRMNSYMNL